MKNDPREEIVVLWTSLPIPNDDLDAVARAMVTAEERREADAFRIARDRSRFPQRRAFRRRMVADLLGAPPGDIAFGTGDFGQPSVTAPGRWHLSASARADLAVVAVGGQGPFGIDLELPRTGRDIAALVATVFSPFDPILPFDGRGPEAERLFHDLWTAKEAVLKALGTGLRHDPAALTWRPAEDTVEPVPGSPDIGTWRLRRPLIRADAYFAVATRTDREIPLAAPVRVDWPQA